MAPEQIEGKPVDARTDVYAAGLVLFEMLAGRPPFDDKDNVSLAFAHAARPPLTLAECGAACPPELEQIVARTLAKTREERFSSAMDLARALHGVLQSVKQSTSVGKGLTLRISTVPSSGSPYIPPEDMAYPMDAPKKRLHPAVIVLVLVLVLVLGVDLVLVILRSVK